MFPAARTAHIPWICDIDRVSHAAPVGRQIILGRRRFPVAWERGGHGRMGGAGERLMGAKNPGRVDFLRPIGGGEPISSGQ